MKIQLLSPAGEIHRNTTGIFKPRCATPLTLTTLAALVPEELNAEIDHSGRRRAAARSRFSAEPGRHHRHHRHGAAGLCRSPTSLRAKGHTVVIGGVHRDAACPTRPPARRRRRARLRREIVAAAAARLRPRRTENALLRADRPSAGRRADRPPRSARRRTLRHRQQHRGDARLSAQVRLLRGAHRLGQHLRPSAHRGGRSPSCEPSRGATPCSSTSARSRTCITPRRFTAP